jgi:protein-tyrosine phosphatase
MFKLVFVCSGNRCRSPFAEAYLKKAAPFSWLRIESAGTLELGPAAPTHEMIVTAAKFGVDLSKHRARSLQKAQLGDADLVIGMTLEHVAAASVDGGVAPERCFTLVELTDVISTINFQPSGDPEQDARELVARLHANRRAGSQGVRQTDILDPIGGSRRYYRKIATQIKERCDLVADALRGDTEQ